MQCKLSYTLQGMSTRVLAVTHHVCHVRNFSFVMLAPEVLTQFRFQACGLGMSRYSFTLWWPWE